MDSAVDSDIAQQLQKGFDALNLGQLEVAEWTCQTILAKHPELAPAHFLVGLIAIEGDEHRVAHEAFKSVVKLYRDHTAAWAQLARLNASEGGVSAQRSAAHSADRPRHIGSHRHCAESTRGVPYRQGIFCAGQ